MDIRENETVSVRPNGHGEPATTARTHARDTEQHDLRYLSRSVVGHVAGLAREASNLVHEEARLARAEVSEKLKEVQHGVTSAASGGAVLFAGALVLLFALVYGLALAMPLWLSAFIVGAVTCIIGAIMVAAGRKTLQKQNLKPDRTISSTRRVAEHTKEMVQ